MRSHYTYYFAFLLVLLLSTSLQLAYGQTGRFTIVPRLGYGAQNLDWSIAGNIDGMNPNILSELIWTDVSGMNFGLHATAKILPNLDLIIDGDYQNTRNGRVRDTDYTLDNRRGINYDEHFSSKKGYFYNFRVGARYTLPRVGPLSPRIILAYEQLGNELFLLPLADGGSDPNTRTTYKTDWYGGQMALELAYAYRAFYASASYGFGLNDYKAKANWNLREEFQQPVSYRHKALGLKQNGILRLGYQIMPRLGIELQGNYTNAFTRAGIDELYTRNSGTIHSRLNGVNFSHYSGSMGVRFNF